MRANADIRAIAKEHNVYLYEVAERLNISEPTMTRKLRRELSHNEKLRIKQIIYNIAKEKTAQSGNSETVNKEIS